MIGDWWLSDLQAELGGELAGSDTAFSGLSIDTRTLQPGDVFLALKGPSFDGHCFIDQAMAKGAVAAVVSELQPVNLPQWRVTDTHAALGQIAALNRKRFKGPVFAVTGSVGKTSVKEMLATLLAQKGPVLATRGNLNNDIGAPLTLLSIQAEHLHAVVELGASAEKEIAYTTALTLPDVAVLNNAMAAHLEGFGSLEGIVRAKGEIFDGLSENGRAIINLDDPHAEYWLAKNYQRNVLTFSIENPAADVRATNLVADAQGCFSFKLSYGDQSGIVTLKVMGRHNVANAAAATAAVLAAGYPLSLAVDGLVKFEAVSGRMCPCTGPDDLRVIDDSYNANPGSVKAAIDLLASLPGKRLLLLGDMAELGDDAAAQHSDMGNYAAKQGVDRLMAAGALSLHAVNAFNAAAGTEGGHFETREQMVDAVRALTEPGMTILVKGSRSAGMEQVVAELVKGTF
ncbi:MAG: UDP-N-acetylmuramoyl-tripeptide--D-alanyl-D-alanine ligase [Pontibacterium sp.]